MLSSIAAQVRAAQEAAAVADRAKALEMGQRAHEEEERIAKAFYATGIGRVNQNEMRRLQREVVRLERKVVLLEREVGKLGGELEAARNKSALQDIH
jgi:predicted  nucleic acid-binding Zn-ribbon protein